MQKTGNATHICTHCFCSDACPCSIETGTLTNSILRDSQQKKRYLVYLNFLKCIVIFFHTSILTRHQWKLNPLLIILYFWLFKCTKFFQTSLLFHFPDTSATTSYAICLYINQITLFHSTFPIGKWPDWEEVQSESRESSLEALEYISANDGSEKQRQQWQR